MARAAAVLFPLLLSAACASGDHTAWEDVPLCSATLTQALPADGEDVIGTNAEIILAFEGQMIGIGGANLTIEPAMDYSYVVDGDRVIFQPADLLDADTEYSWSASLCDAQVASGSFTTRSEGERLEDPAVLQDRTFSMDMLAADWIEPSGGGADLLAQYFGGIFLVGVEDVSDTELDVMFAVGEDIGGGQVQQDPCYETVDFEPADFTRNPYFELGPKRMPLDVQGQAVMLDSVRIFGALIDEGTDLADAVMLADADLRQLGADWETYCEYGQIFGISCTACDVDGEEACVKLHIENIAGKVQAGVTIQEVTDPAAECATGDTKETDTSGA